MSKGNIKTNISESRHIYNKKMKRYLYHMFPPSQSNLSCFSSMLYIGILKKMFDVSKRLLIWCFINMFY